jgi:predicted NBD/HSP70 family sugar kinase
MDVIEIRKQNLLNIIRLLRFEDNLTKRNIANKTGLSFATVSNLCNDLIDQGILIRGENTTLTVGRTPLYLSFNVDLFVTICVNLQMRDVIVISLLNFRNQEIIKRAYNPPKTYGAENVVAFIKNKFDTEIRPLCNEQLIIIGIGVAVSSIFDTDSGQLINSRVDIYDNINLKFLFEESFDIPTYVDNESNLCAYSIKSISHDLSDIVYLHISEGVGVGMIVNGKLLSGERGYAGELAHMPIGTMDIKCPYCGNMGCVENDLAVESILIKYYGFCDDKIAQWNCLLSKMEEGEEAALTLAESCCSLLGKLSSILINLMNPNTMYIGGDIAKLLSFGESAFWAEINKRCLLLKYGPMDIKFDLHSDETINIGINERICSSWIPGKTELEF